MADRIKRYILSWVVVIAVVLVLRATFVEAVVIPTGSMEKTLLVGDALLVNRFIYGVKLPIPFSNQQIPLIPGRDPRIGEIIAFSSPIENRYVVKRCIATEGDRVEIVDKVLYVNGERAWAQNMTQCASTVTFVTHPVIWLTSASYNAIDFSHGGNFRDGTDPEKWSDSEDNPVGMADCSVKIRLKSKMDKRAVWQSFVFGETVVYY